MMRYCEKAFTDILNCCDINFTYILFHMANLLNEFVLRMVLPIYTTNLLK